MSSPESINNLLIYLWVCVWHSGAWDVAQVAEWAAGIPDVKKADVDILTKNRIDGRSLLELTKKEVNEEHITFKKDV
jgi:hypothetical protein